MPELAILQLSRKSYALYQMVMLAMTLGDFLPHNEPNFCIFVAFHFFVVGEYRDFKFGTQLDRNYYQPTDDDCPERGMVMVTWPI